MIKNRGFLASVLAMYLSKEDPNNIALVLSQLDPILSADVLARLPEEMQTDDKLVEVIFHIGSMTSGHFKDGLSQDIKTMMLDKFLDDAGGPKVAADVLNRMGRTTAQCLLDRLDAQDPELAEEVRNEMYTFDDIARQSKQEIQLVLQEADMKDLAIGLKGGSKALKERIFATVDEETKNKIKAEMECAGPVRMHDVEEIQLRIVQIVRALEEKGQLKIPRKTFSGRLSNWRPSEDIFI